MALFRSVENCRSLHILVLALLGLGKNLRVKFLVEIWKRKVVPASKKFRQF